VRDGSGKVVAALDVGAATSRLTMEDLTARILPRLLAAAEEMRELAGLGL